MTGWLSHTGKVDRPRLQWRHTGHNPNIGGHGWCDLYKSSRRSPTTILEYLRAGLKNLGYFGLKNLVHDVPLDKSGLAFMGQARTGLRLGRAVRVICTTNVYRAKFEL
jgi:hypothetical protein